MPRKRRATKEGTCCFDAPKPDGSSEPAEDLLATDVSEEDWDGGPNADPRLFKKHVCVVICVDIFFLQ